jgi:uncharacterized protein YbaR (Trm112 family)
MQIPFLFDWKKSKAHYELLSKFIKCESFDKLTKDEYWASAWKEVLKESPQKAIERLIKEGYLENAKLPEALDYLFKATELKTFCSERGLKVSGKKAELIERLIIADEKSMKNKISNQRLLSCTESGHILAEEYLEKNRKEKDDAENIILQALKKKDIHLATKTMISYEASQVFPRGLGTDWSKEKEDSYLPVLSLIFSGTPEILAGIPSEKLENLRVIAAFEYLLAPKQDLYTTIERVSEKYENFSIANMLFSYAKNRTDLDGFRQLARDGIGKMIITIDTCNDELVCKECNKIAKKKYRLTDSIPELPNPNCTCEDGCRCWYGFSIK